MVVTDRPGSASINRITAREGMILRDLRLRSLAESPEAFGQTVAEARALPAIEWHRSARQSSHGDARTWLLAKTGHEVVGVVQGRKRRPHTLLLFSMWVDPTARRLGMGRRLIEELEAWAIRWGATATVLWVYRGNSAAIRFYTDLGFAVIAKGEDVEAGARFGAVAMERDIKAVEPDPGVD
jgi:GNAT superfamily N-acetyltransferase